jgi:hypothetical protein
MNKTAIDPPHDNMKITDRKRAQAVSKPNAMLINVPISNVMPRELKQNEHNYMPEIQET